jgi:hypothetical protein
MDVEVKAVTSPVEDIPTELAEVMKLGWTADDGRRALKAVNGVVADAIELLTKEDEDKVKFDSLVDELVNKHYWNQEISELALREANMNVSQALEIIENEEAIQIENFERSVKEMVENGWDEFIARQALIAQAKLDARKASGFNDTVPADVLAQLRPTFRRSNETEESKASATTNNKSSNKGKSKSQPKPAKKEDCVFEVTANNFQQLVLESSVPILLDLYADWCGVSLNLSLAI